MLLAVVGILVFSVIAILVGSLSSHVRSAQPSEQHGSTEDNRVLVLAGFDREGCDTVFGDLEPAPDAPLFVFARVLRVK
jgi:hypothetical protein